MLNSPSHSTNSVVSSIPVDSLFDIAGYSPFCENRRTVFAHIRVQPDRHYFNVIRLEFSPRYRNELSDMSVIVVTSPRLASNTEESLYVILTDV
jgi:hypothetical protein